MPLRDELLSSTSLPALAAPPKKAARKIVSVAWQDDRIVPVYEGETVEQWRLVSEGAGVATYEVTSGVMGVDF